MVDDWYRPNISRKELKALMARGDARGLINFGIWGICLALSGYAAYKSVGSAWVIPAFFPLRDHLQLL